MANEYVYSKDDCILRSRPEDDDGNILRTLYAGHVLTVLGLSPHWYSVYSNVYGNAFVLIEQTTVDAAEASIIVLEPNFLPLAEMVINTLIQRNGFEAWWGGVDEGNQDDILRQLSKLIEDGVNRLS